MIAPNKPSEACLSHLQISQWALGDVDPAHVARFDAHAQGCERCNHLISDERDAVRAASTMPLPPHLIDATARAAVRQVRIRRMVSFGALIVASIVAVVTLHQESDTERMKGHGALSVAVRRDGVVNEHVLDSQERFRAGDGVRLRVSAGALAWVLVQKRTESRWQQVYLGHPDKEGWLPLSFTISESPAVPVRVLVCTDAPDDAVQDVQSLRGCSVQETQF